MNETVMVEGEKFVQTLLNGSESGIISYQDAEGSIASLEPSESLFGYTYHGHMVPPFMPESMLILGYGEGTIANLTRKVWGLGLKVTGVDIGQISPKFIEYEMVDGDAFAFVKDCADISALGRIPLHRTWRNC